MNTRNKIRFCLNILITVLMLSAWGIMAFRYRGGSLGAAGIASMKFFTVLSNVFCGIVSAVMAVCIQKGCVGKKLTIWNYVSTCSVGLTFLVVFVFFGPLYGYLMLLQGGNFFFHLIIPVLSMAEYVIFNETPIRMPKSLTAALPPLVYGLCYLINLLVNGIGYGPNSNDWYGFAIWGIPIGLCIFAAICAASVLIGLVLNRLNEIILAGQKRK